MRTFLMWTLIAAATLLTQTGCSRKAAPASPFSVIPVDKVDQAQKQTAERVAFRLLSAWRDGTFEPLGEEFAPTMRAALDPRAQRAAQEIFAAMGAFQSLEFVEVLGSTMPEAIAVYRFRGTFGEGSEKPEVRVVFDIRGQIGGFWIKAWQDVMK